MAKHLLSAARKIRCPWGVKFSRRFSILTDFLETDFLEDYAAETFATIKALNWGSELPISSMPRPRKSLLMSVDFEYMLKILETQKAIKAKILKIDIPQNRVSVIVGKAGKTIKHLQLQSGAKIQVLRYNNADPNSVTRPVELVGTAEQIAKAEQLINDVLAEVEAGGSGMVSRRMTGQDGSGHFEMKIPSNKVGLVIGKGGEAIKSMQARTGARVQVIPLHLPPGDTSTERTLHIDETGEQIKHARDLVDEVISENRVRNPAMVGYGGYHAAPQSGYGQPSSYDQQQGYRTAPSYSNATNPVQGDLGQAPTSTQQSAMGQRGGSQSGYGMPPTSQTGYGNQPPAQSGEQGGTAKASSQS